MIIYLHHYYVLLKDFFFFLDFYHMRAKNTFSNLKVKQHFCQTKTNEAVTHGNIAFW